MKDWLAKRLEKNSTTESSTKTLTKPCTETIELEPEKCDNRICLAADSTQIADFLKCPRLWYYRYVRNLEKVIEKDKDRRRLAFDRGTLVHKMLDDYYNLTPSMYPTLAAKEVLKKFNTELQNSELGIYVTKEDRDLIALRFHMYTMWYQTNDWKALVVNGKPQVEVGFSVPLLDDDKYYFVLEGRIDLITSNEIFVDHKTQARRNELYNYSPQFLTYALATELSQGCINYVSLTDKVDKDTFRRQPFTVSSEQKARWKNKLIKIFTQMSECHRNQTFETNEASCQDGYGICEFTTLDEISEENKDFRERLIQVQYRQRDEWKPWKPERTDSTNVELKR